MHSTLTANAKAVAGRARKAEAADKKSAEAAAKQQAAEDATWEKGAKGKSAADAKAEKAQEAARKKAEKERLLAEEEASLPSKPVKAPGGKAGKKDPKGGAWGGKAPAGPGIDDAIASFNASNIDDALDALTLATEKTDKATVGSKAAALERHPERRFKVSARPSILFFGFLLSHHPHLSFVLPSLALSSRPPSRHSRSARCPVSDPNIPVSDCNNTKMCSTRNSRYVVLSFLPLPLFIIPSPTLNPKSYVGELGSSFALSSIHSLYLPSSPILSYILLYDVASHRNTPTTHSTKSRSPTTPTKRPKSPHCRPNATLPNVGWPVVLSGATHAIRRGTGLPGPCRCRVV